MPTQWTAFQLGTRAALLSAVLSLFAIPANAQQNGVATGRSGAINSRRPKPQRPMPPLSLPHGAGILFPGAAPLQ